MPYKITTDPQRNGDLYNIWGNGQRLAKHVPNKTTARLFAATPDLLEALEAVWNEATWANDPHDNYLVPKEQIRKARAAIAAAKGES